MVSAPKSVCGAEPSCLAMFLPKSALCALALISLPMASAQDASVASWQGSYERSRRLAVDAHKHLREDRLADALDALGEAVDLAVPQRRGFDNRLGTASAGLHRRLVTLNSDERYELLREWSMPTESQPSVRVLEAFVPTEAPPIDFARALGERPRDSSFRVANVGEVSGLFSTVWELVRAADEAGRLRRLTAELEELAAQDIANAPHVLMLARIVQSRRRDDKLIAALREHLRATRDGGSLTSREGSAFADAWQYGYGVFDESSERMSEFTSLPVWSGAAWQTVRDRPDPTFRFLRVDQTGGHPAPTAACIRRWIAPANGAVQVVGSLNHPVSAGDGVRARIVSSRSGLLGKWRAHASAVATEAEVAVQAGESIDFVVDQIDSTAHDSFGWTVQVELTTEDGERLLFDSETDFVGPHDQHVLSDAVLAAACTQRPWLWSIAVGMLERLVEDTHDADTWLKDLRAADSPSLRPALKRAWATVVRKRHSPDANEPLEDPKLSFWQGGSATEDTSWFAHEGRFLHLAGSGDDLLLFKYPLTGEFAFACEVQAGGRPATDGGISYGGQTLALQGCDLLFTTSNGQAYSSPAIRIGSRLGGQYVGQAEFNEMTIASTAEVTTLAINGQPVWSKTLIDDAPPWIGLWSHGDRSPMFRGFKITGDATIPREVRLSLGDQLRGWRSESAEWSMADGVISNAGRVEGEPIAERGSLRYVRPLLGGESISYEFQYAPNKFHVHPALGRLAFLIEPEGVRLHWITAGDREWTGLAEDNSVVVPFDRRGPKPLPLVTNEWNRMTIALGDGNVTLTLNDQLIYNRKLAARGPRTFGFYQAGDRSSVRVKSVVLRGDWPERLTARELQNLAAIDSDVGRDGIAHLFGDEFRPQSVVQVARAAAGLSDQAKFDYLLDKVLPKYGDSPIRLRAVIAPVPEQPNADGLLGLANPIRSSAAVVGLRETDTQLIAPAITLVSIAKDLGRLNELRARLPEEGEVDNSRFDGRGESARQTMLALINIAGGDFKAAIDNLGVLVDANTYGDGRPEDHWPEMIAMWAAFGEPATNQVAFELADVMFEQVRAGRLGKSAAWKRHVASFARAYRFHNELAAFGTTVLATPLRQWQAVSHQSARSHGEGFPRAAWQHLPHRVHNVSGHDRDYLYFQSPLQGDFEVDCEVASSFGWSEGQLAYGGTFTSPWNSLNHYGSGDFREQSFGGAAVRFDPKLTKPEAWKRYRLTVRDGG